MPAAGALVGAFLALPIETARAALQDPQAHMSSDAPDPIAPEVRRAEWIARWLDDRYLDPLVGFLLPGVGDLLASGAGLYIVWVGVRKRLPLIVLARMLLNLGLDALFGAVPF